MLKNQTSLRMAILRGLELCDFFTIKKAQEKIINIYTNYFYNYKIVNYLCTLL